MSKQAVSKTRRTEGSTNWEHRCNHQFQIRDILTNMQAPTPIGHIYGTCTESQSEIFIPAKLRAR